MRFRFCVALISVFVVGRPASVLGGELRPPNILVIHADDVGWGDFQCYNPKGRIPTPNIDALARAGMRFTDAHSPAALCAPTRYSMVTGNYPWRGRHFNGTWAFHDTPQILPGQKTIGHFLQGAGYRTAMLGKTHLGGTFVRRPDRSIDWTRPMIVGGREWGFDYSCLLLGGHQAPPYLYIENNRMVGDPAKVRELPKGPLNGGQLEAPGPGLPDWDSREVGATLVTKALAFLDGCLADSRAGGQPQPFFIHFNTDGAHSPFTPPPRLLGTPVEGVTKMTAHTDMVHAIDVIVGKLVAALTERGMLADTLIVVTSDNGGIPKEREFGHDAVGGLRGSKSTVWEGGHRVPFVMRWGDGTAAGSRIPPGTVRHQVVGTHDLVATFAELAGAAIAPDQALDSVSLAPVLLGQRGDDHPVRSTLLVQSGPVRFPGMMPEVPGFVPPGRGGEKVPGVAFALREGAWKLIIDPQDKPCALFDLASDLAEEKDFLGIPARAGRVARMLRQFHEIRGSNRSAPLRSFAARP